LVVAGGYVGVFGYYTACQNYVPKYGIAV